MAWRICDPLLLSTTTPNKQGEELGGGAHVFALKGYEFETGVHYLGNDPGMNNMLAFATMGRVQLAQTGTPVSRSLNERGAKGKGCGDGDIW